MGDTQALSVSILWNGRCKRSYGTLISGVQGSPSFTLCVLPHSLLLVYLTLSVGGITRLDGVQQRILDAWGEFFIFSLFEQYDSLVQRLPRRCRGGNQHFFALDTGTEAPGSVERPCSGYSAPVDPFVVKWKGKCQDSVCAHVCTYLAECAPSRRSCSDIFQTGYPAWLILRLLSPSCLHGLPGEDGSVGDSETGQDGRCISVQASWPWCPG